MKMIIYTFTQQESRELCIDLIPMGIEGIELTTQDEIIKSITEDQKIQFLLTENHDQTFLERVKSANSKIFIMLIVHNNLKPAELMTLMKVGIQAIVQYNENTSLMVEELVKHMISTNIRAAERRFHIRVQPRDFEQIKAAIFIKNLRKFVRGDVIDISAGGMAIKLHDSLEASLLIPKGVYDPLLISLKGMDVKTISTMVAKRNDAAGFKFDNVEVKDMRKIASYIHSRFSENSKDLMNDTTPAR